MKLSIFKLWQPAPAPKLTILDAPVRASAPAVQRQEYVATHLQRGWDQYPVARKTFATWSCPPAYRYEPAQRVIAVCGILAIYLALSGADAEDAARVNLQAIEFGITRLTGVNYRRVFGPAVQDTEYLRRGEPVDILSHIMTLTDKGWPKQEIIAWTYGAEEHHRRLQIGT